MNLQVNGGPIDWNEALEVVLGNAFAEDKLRWRRASSFVGSDVTGTVPRWAYRSSDCVPPGEGCELSDIDVLVPNAINAQMRGAVIAGLGCVSSELSVQIAALDSLGLAFWEFEANEIAERPADADRAWPLWRAWSIVEGVPGAGIAVSHKLLHYKRPRLFPLLDRKTHAELGGRDEWRQIHQDLSVSQTWWEALEQAFTEEALCRHGVCLTRLRLHDILLWTRATGAWDACRAGSPRNRRPGPSQDQA